MRVIKITNQLSDSVPKIVLNVMYMTAIIAEITIECGHKAVNYNAV